MQMVGPQAMFQSRLSPPNLGQTYTKTENFLVATDWSPSNVLAKQVVPQKSGPDMHKNREKF